MNRTTDPQAVIAPRDRTTARRTRTSLLRRMTPWLAASATLLVLVSGLVAVTPAHAEGTATLTPVDTSPRLNQVWSMASHNSYYFAPNGFEERGTGPSQHLLDTLYIDRMRSLEFDLHPDPDQKDAFNPEGKWGVPHQQAGR